MFNFFKTKPKEAAQLCFRTDIHCHLAPGIDDGSPDATTSVELIDRMNALGIEKIYTSPHITLSTFENNARTIGHAMELLDAELKKNGNPTPVMAHAEHRIDDLFAQMLEEGSVRPLPNNYLLVENSFLQEPWNLEQTIFDLQVKGYQPILAHPERYAYYWKNTTRYTTLHQAGLLFQINLISLTGNYGKMEKKLAEWLIAQGYVDFIGTDIHKHRHIDAIEEYLHTAEAHAHMKQLAGLVKNDELFA